MRLLQIFALLICVLAHGVADAGSIAVENSKNESAVRALRMRQAAKIQGYEAFKKKTYKEPFQGGVYIVNGDTPLADELELREFYQKEISAEWKSTRFGLSLSSASPDLIADAPQGTIKSWDDKTKKALAYCVSNDFKGDYQRVVLAMAEATKAWEAASDVKFSHSPWLDVLCNNATTDVIFDVRPVNVNGQYLARAFFPRFPREQRSLLIDRTALNLKPGKLTLAGVLRHELGHVLSFRHEQTRPEAGACFEDNDWKTLTSYDGFSVMHYPQCNGLGDWSLVLTEKDVIGASCLYGAPKGKSFDVSICYAQ